MFNTIARLYEKTGKIIVVKNAVKEKYISTEDYKKITGEEYAN